MKPAAFIGALVGAVLGALIWGGIAAATGYELGLIAWGIGGLVGLGAAMLGGSGATSGGICAVLALMAIFGGKVLTINFIAPGELRKIAEEELTQNMYNEEVRQAQVSLQMTSQDKLEPAEEQDAGNYLVSSSEETPSEPVSREKYAQFMIEHQYTEAKFPENVTDEELQYFEEEGVPYLSSFLDQYPSFEVWQEEGVAKFTEAMIGQLPLMEMVKESLGIYDILFALLGLGTAFKIGAGIESEHA